MPTLPDGEYTFVTISGGALTLTPYGSRGITQTLEFIPAAKAGGVRRDINGNAIDMSYEQFQKYKSTISCSDFDIPVITGVQVGDLVTVACAIEIGGTMPTLSMIVTDIRISFAEWEATYAWQIDLEEI
jgi:hypothetical protein